MAPAQTKIVIVGGSVTGLTLANILERLNIDYVLLEAYEKIAPQLGASIALWSNGLRLLDQLGCYDDFVKDVMNIDTGILRLEGEPFGQFQGFGSQHQKRHGYGLIFNDRQTLLEILYNNLKDKSKVLTKKRLVKIEPTKSGVIAHTQDGDSFTGDMVIGADGIHSATRQEMRRIAADIAPNYFSKDELQRVPVNYTGLFGMAKAHPKFPPGLVNSSWHKGHSYLICNGPNGRIYWFLFAKNEKTRYYADTPRFSKEQTAELAKELLAKHRNDSIREGSTFGELHDMSYSVDILPVHEWTFEKWHFQRILTLGDAAHKHNPLTGQGGNNAMEDVAVFVNALTAKLDTVSGPLSDADINAIFSETQTLRRERAALSVDLATRFQKLEALERPVPAFALRLLMPLVSRDQRMEREAQILTNSVKVDKLPLPKKPHFLPFLHELPAKPLKNAGFPRLAAGLAFAGLFYLSNNALRLPQFPSSWSFLGAPFKTVFTGRAKLDGLITILVKFFSGSIVSAEPAKRIQAMYLCAMIIPTLVIWTVESRRRGNTHGGPGLLVTWPSITAVLYQLQGIAKIGPLYYLLSLYTSNNPFYQRTTGRPVEPATAKALLPAVAFGYVVPSVLMFTPFGDLNVWQNCIAAWQVAPILVSPLTSLFAAIIRRIEGRKPADPRGLAELQNRDVPHLLSAYSFAFFSAAVAHMALLGFIAGTPGLSFARVFWDLPSPFGSLSGMETGEAIFSFFKYDLLGYASASLVWCLYSVYEMRRQGYATTCQAWKAALGVVASLPLFGPGAMYAGTWYWRENTIVKQCKWSDGDEE